MSDAPALRDDYAHVTREITRIPMHFPGNRTWSFLFAGALALLLLWFIAVIMLFSHGVGIWGNDIPVNWGLAIINYVWFLGIGHAGTLISAMLLLVGRNWRNSLNRFAEAMTLMAVICAGLYPILHLGRPWFFYWMAPYPNSMGIWPQFKSPLAIDFWAVLIYLLVSLLFWYLGIVPDLAAARDRAKKKRWQIFFGLLSLGWRGASAHWLRWEQAYRITAAIAVATVVMVTASYSLLFAMGPIPGWSSEIFPAYFLVGAVFSGFAVVGMITVVMRHALGLYDIITDHHLDMLGKMTLATGFMTAYGYFIDAFNALYAGKEELKTLIDRVSGSYSWVYWGAVLLNFVPLQLFWSRRMRTHSWALFLIGLSIAIGMWLERFMLIVTALYKDWLVSSWGSYAPSFWEWALFAGMAGVFFVPFLLFVRFLPVSAAFEINRASHEEAQHG